MNTTKKIHPYIQHQFDVLIIGGGAAGLSLALKLPDTLSVGLCVKGSMKQSSTYLAQGGISAVISDEDSLEVHISDTIKAGAGLCDPAVVTAVINQAPYIIDWLCHIGVPFTTSYGLAGKSATLHLHQEGGHSRRRVVHSYDRTGAAVQMTLLDHARQKSNICIINDRTAVDLIINENNACSGAYLFNSVRQQVESALASIVVLATGGAGKAYLYTSNSDGASGDGIAMAWRAGCRVANMEFMQFHPTCLYHPKAKYFLISEALRGEGAKLLLPGGERFMHKFDARGELAPRDIVAYAIDFEMKRLGLRYVLLDISAKTKSFLTRRFPAIYRRCLQFGYDLAVEAIPVVPAMHYTCGGVMTDLSGYTDIENLYAIGETAYTGLHGANRMAGNSLLECIAFAQFAAESIARNIAQINKPVNFAAWDESRVTSSKEEVMITQNWSELRQIMWNYVGIVRTQQRLNRAWQRVRMLHSEVDEYYRHFRINKNLIELRNLCLITSLIIQSSLSRHESRGLHYIQDYPKRDPRLDGVITILNPGNNPDLFSLENQHLRKCSR